MSLAAYRKTIRETDAPRDVERRVLAGINRSLAASGPEYDAEVEMLPRLQILSAGLRETLFRNRKFWSLLRDDLADPGNAMPPSLRASLISLALWVDRQTSAVLSGEGDVQPIIDVNKTIIAGLSGTASVAPLES